MNFEEIKARYLAGETNLSAETAFLFKTQGPSAAYDFARQFDEEVGSAPYNLIMGHIEKLEAQAMEPAVNAAEQNRIALELAKKQADKAAASAENKRLADELTLNKNKSLPNPVDVNKTPLFENLPKLTGGLGMKSPADLNPEIKSGMITAGSLEKLAKSPLVLVAAGLLLVYFITRK